jgi:hypothetical protein
MKMKEQFKEVALDLEATANAVTVATEDFQKVMHLLSDLRTKFLQTGNISPDQLATIHFLGLNALTDLEDLAIELEGHSSTLLQKVSAPGSEDKAKEKEIAPKPKKAVTAPAKSEKVETPTRVKKTATAGAEKVKTVVHAPKIAKIEKVAETEDKKPTKLEKAKTVIAIEDVRKLLMSLSASGQQKEAKALLDEVGASRVSELEEKRFGFVSEKAEALIAESKAKNA